ncbi:MAG: ribonuclease HI family protein [Candidatus Thorarchaeota archaeon]
MSKKKVIILANHRLNTIKKLISNNIKGQEIEFSHINDEFLEEQIKQGNIELSDVVKVIWSLSEGMDNFENDFLSFKVDLLERLNIKSEEKERQKPEDVFVGYFDGSAVPNPGEMKVGGFIINETKKKKIFEYSEKMGEGTNNQAEYLSLIMLLRVALDKGITKISIKGDSMLVVKQVNQEWKVKNSMMKRLNLEIQDLLAQFDEWTLSHIYREDNTDADNLTK